MDNRKNAESEDQATGVFVFAIVLVIIFSLFIIGLDYDRKENLGYFPASELYVGRVVRHKADGGRFTITRVFDDYKVDLQNSTTTIYKTNPCELEPFNEKNGE